MNGLQVFQNTEFGELNIQMIDGVVYFPAKQCATKLGYKNHSQQYAYTARGY